MYWMLKFHDTVRYYHILILCIKMYSRVLLFLHNPYILVEYFFWEADALVHIHSVICSD